MSGLGPSLKQEEIMQVRRFYLAYIFWVVSLDRILIPINRKPNIWLIVQSPSNIQSVLGKFPPCEINLIVYTPKGEMAFDLIPINIC